MRFAIWDFSFWNLEYLESGISGIGNIWNLESGIWNLESVISGIRNIWNLEYLESGVSGVSDFKHLEPVAFCVFAGSMI
ncbi:MAG: hypothetical protein IPK58_00995 [Acidobacteria bacterium]|nr:hypothetical protein [Acidobacteriota bacterium]